MSLGEFFIQTVSTNDGDLNLLPVVDVNLGPKVLKWIPTTTTGSETRMIPLNGNYNNADTPITVLTILPSFGTLGSVYTFRIEMTTLVNSSGTPFATAFHSYNVAKCASSIITTFGPFSSLQITEPAYNFTPNLFIDSNSTTEIYIKFIGLNATDINNFNAIVTITSQIV